MPETHKDARQILGLQENASEQEIKDAYKELARKHHPDKCSNPSRE